MKIRKPVKQKNEWLVKAENWSTDVSWHVGPAYCTAAGVKSEPGEKGGKAKENHETRDSCLSIFPHHEESDRDALPSSFNDMF